MGLVRTPCRVRLVKASHDPHHLHRFTGGAESWEKGVEKGRERGRGRGREGEGIGIYERGESVSGAASSVEMN